MSDLDLSTQDFSFEKTPSEDINIILASIIKGSKLFRDTEKWGEDLYGDETTTVASLIQKNANEIAEKIDAMEKVVLIARAISVLNNDDSTTEWNACLVQLSKSLKELDNTSLSPKHQEVLPSKFPKL